MPDSIILSVQDAKLVRGEIRKLIKLRDRLTKLSDAATLRDLYLTTGVLKEIVKYLDSSLFVNISEPMNRLLKKIRKRLNPIQQTETITRLLRKCQQGRRENAVGAELALSHLLHQKTQRKRTLIHSLSGNRFRDVSYLLIHIKGSSQIQTRQSDLLEMRMKEFLAFPWNVAMDDRILLQLSTATENLLYGVKIDQAVIGNNHSHLLTKIRKLAAMLDEIGGFVELQTIVTGLKNKWNHRNLALVPSSLNSLYETITRRKMSLTDRVYASYAAVVQGFLPSFRSGLSKPLQSASSVTESKPVLKIVRKRSA